MELQQLESRFPGNQLVGEGEGKGSLPSEDDPIGPRVGESGGGGCLWGGAIEC